MEYEKRKGCLPGEVVRQFFPTMPAKYRRNRHGPPPIRFACGFDQSNLVHPTPGNGMVTLWEHGSKSQ